MRVLIKGGQVLDLSRPDKTDYRADVLVEGETIKEVGDPSGPPAKVDRVIDAEGKLVMPGLVNAHMHSETHLQKGSFSGLPLEVWLPQVVPVFSAPMLPLEVPYLSAMLGAVHMLKRGVTTTVDHWIESVPFAEGFAQVVRAYEESGIRATVGIDMSNVPLHEELPTLGDILPKGIKDRLGTASDPKGYLELCRELAAKYGAPARRVRAMLGYSATPRCTDDLLEGLAGISAETGLQMHGHMLETRVQRLEGTRLYKEGLLKHMDSIGFLSPRLTVAHSVWVTAQEASLMAKRGVSVVHNPVSNLRMGSGIMPRKMLHDAGVNIGLGTDGASSNDNLNMFEVMKCAATLHNLPDYDFETWPKSTEILRYATVGGARAAGLQDRVGSLEPGMCADLVIVNLRSTTHQPLNDIANQLVYADDGQNVETVLVNGEVVVEHGRTTKVDEAQLLEAVAGIGKRYRAHVQGIVSTNAELIPYLTEMYMRLIRDYETRPLEGRRFA